MTPTSRITAANGTTDNSWLLHGRFCAQLAHVGCLHTAVQAHTAPSSVQGQMPCRSTTAPPGHPWEHHGLHRQQGREGSTPALTCPALQYPVQSFIGGLQPVNFVVFLLQWQHKYRPPANSCCKFPPCNNHHQSRPFGGTKLWRTTAFHAPVHH